MFKQQILDIFRHELAHKKRSPILWIVFFMIQLLLGIALYTGWQQYQHSLTTQVTAQSMVEEQWLAQPDRHPHRVAHFGHFAFRPPGALSFFDLGVNTWVGHSIFLEAHKQNSANFADDQDASSLLRFSELSTANILLLIWPILIIAMGFSSICGERKSGTLRQLMSMGIPFRYLVLGKGLNYLLISLFFVLPVFIFTLVLSINSGMQFTLEEMARVGLLFCVYLLYCIFWIGLTLLASSLIREPKQSLILLTSIWFVFTIIMPRVLAEFAHNQYPHQKRNDFELAIKLDNRKIGNSHNPNDPYFSKFREDTLKKYGVKSIEELPLNYNGLVMQEGERLTAKVFAEHYRKQMDQFSAQQAFIGAFYWVNPYLFVRDLSMAITRSDTKHFFDFEKQAEAHRYNRTQKLNKLHASEIHQHDDRGQRTDKSHWQSFREFSYQAPNLSWSLNMFSFRWLPSLIVILLLFVLLCSKTMQRRVYATV